MRGKFKYLLVLLLCLLPASTKALCTSSDKARLKKIMSNINISYDYEMVKNNAIFSIKFSNLSPELYFTDQYGNYYTQYDANNEIVLNNFSDGKSYSFAFYATGKCNKEKIGTLYATTPTYNPYYKLSVCNNAREFELCQKWVSHSLSKDEFINKVNEYKNKNGIIDDTEVNKKISVIDFAMSFIRMYGLYIAGAIIIVIIVIKFIRYKKDTFGF